jgi:hypothetical protein
MGFVFDATQHEPLQAGGKHPPGNKFPFTITNTEVKKVKDSDNKLFEVTYTSPAGSVRFNYNLWNTSDTARKIAVGQFAALCHATGIMRVTFPNDSNEGPAGKELIGGKGLMDVGFQSGQEPSAEKPEGGYVEIKKIYDINGNEPGKGPARQTSSGFGQNTQQVANVAQSATPAIQQNWGGDKKPETANAGGWQPGANAATTEKPPWS